VPLIEDEQLAEFRRRGGNGGTIPTAPTGPAPGSGSGSSGSGSASGSDSSSGAGTSGGSSGGSGGSGGGGGGGGGNYRHKAGVRYQHQADNLLAQARSLRYALRNSYGDALRQKLQNVNEILAAQDQSLMQGYRERVASLAGALDDNNKAAGTQTSMNTGNQIRERGNALSEIAAQGAGESDALAAQMMSLRNWNANQSEIERTKFDTLRSINSGLTDLNVDTKSGRINLQAQALADKEQLWTNYYNQRSETLTQLGNVLGQRADYLDYAKEYGVGKGGDTKQMEKAFMQAAKASGKAWDNPGISKKLRRWDGRDDFQVEGGSQGRLNAAPTVDLGKRPEGATLRTW
jgi:hypothetical protein